MRKTLSSSQVIKDKLLKNKGGGLTQHSSSKYKVLVKNEDEIGRIPLPHTFRI